jgi:hypothetical protein
VTRRDGAPQRLRSNGAVGAVLVLVLTSIVDGKSPVGTCSTPPLALVTFCARVRWTKVRRRSADLARPRAGLSDLSTSPIDYYVPLSPVRATQTCSALADCLSR